ncbi:germination protein YpeB [Clostridium sp. CAG:465]|nr:germination protein YpeB [Clostridium sp. CAG:465]
MIEKIEIKLNKLKKKVNKKVLNVAIFMTFGALIIFSLEMTNNFKRQKNLVQDEYNKSMYLAVSYINNVEVDLAKLLVTSTPKMSAVTLADIWKQANLAKECLEQIPVGQNSMANASKYLTQVSDFSYTLMKQNISDIKLTEEEYEKLKHIYEDSSKLSSKMSDIYDDLNAGRIKWDELEKIGNEKLPDNDISNSISEVGKTFQNYEGLIYDGAFSDHLLSSEPKFLSQKEISEDDAKKYIEEVILNDEKIDKIEFKGESNGKIELYNFDVTLDSKQKRTISITKNDCKLYLMIGDKKVKEENISVDEAKKRGMEFLNKLGIDNMTETYYQKTENMIVINYAATQDGVILYPDLIKVKISLDDGKVYGVEAAGYIFNHTTRNNLKPSISQEKAKSILNSSIEIISSDMALIPTESNSEILTYEFKGKIDNREFLIYINADNAREEKVLLVIDNKNGVLTM